MLWRVGLVEWYNQGIKKESENRSLAQKFYRVFVVGMMSRWTPDLKNNEWCKDVFWVVLQKRYARHGE